MATSQDFVNWVCGPDITPEYLYWALRGSDQTFRKEKQGSTHQTIYMPVLERFHLLHPVRSEQQRIAAILDQADALRAKRRAVLAKLDALSSSIFLELFGDPVANTRNWPMRSLKNLGCVKTGGTPPTEKPGMFGGQIPFVTPGDLETDAPSKRTLTEDGAAEAETIRKGATLVCCIGATIGKMAQARCRSAFNQQINAIEWHDSIDDDYGLDALRFFKTRIARWGASTTLPILKKSSFEKIEIPVPPLDLQRELARRVQAIDALKAAQRRSLAKLDALFASLQHRAFRGEL